MKLAKMDLSSLLAIAHSGGNLQLLLERGNQLELMQIPTSVEAFEGLQHLNQLITESVEPYSMEDSTAILPLSSSMAYAMEYDIEEKILKVEFPTGAIYQYLEVAEETWEELNTADSIGSFFNREIQGRYECERIDIDEDNDQDYEDYDDNDDF
jgi:hypothetical protein